MANSIVDPKDPDYCETCGGECVANHPKTDVGVKEHSHVTVTFELTGIDHNRFIEWLQVECGVAEDGIGKIAGKVRMIDPIGIALHNWEGK